MSVVAFKPVDGDDPVHAVLKEAIKVASDAKAQLANLQQQIARMEEMILGHRAIVEQTVRAVTAALEADALVLAESGTMPVAPSAPRARAAAQEANEALTLSRSALQTLRKDLPAAEQRTYLAERRLDSALGDALRLVAEPMLAEVKKLQGQLARLQVGLSQIGRAGDPEFHKRIESAFSLGADEEGAVPGLAARWETALAAMRAGDLDIELPS
jgi:hypothetical protein